MRAMKWMSHLVPVWALTGCLARSPLLLTVPEGESCRTDQDCRDELVCVLDACRKPCVNNDDCTPDQRCYGGGCAPVSVVFCGNGTTDPDESCDDGNDAAGDSCPSGPAASCAPARCGDGFTWSIGGNERCDAGGEDTQCDTDCTLARCGDGVVNSSAGEQCDGPGETADCDLDCTPMECGDGIINRTAGEECDEGDNCDASCRLLICEPFSSIEICHNGIDEDCDDRVDECCAGARQSTVEDALAASGPVSAMRVADLNNDTILDFAMTRADTDAIAVVLGESNGQYLAPATTPTCATPVDLVVADLDTDHIVDVVVACAGSDQVGVHLGQGDSGVGTGDFGSVVSFATGGAPVAIAVVDVDGDRIHDVVTANRDGTVAILIGQGSGGRGDGSFAPPALLSIGSGATDLLVADIDGGGVNDIICTTSTGALHIMLGQSDDGIADGTFAATLTVQVGGSLAAVTAADFDGNSRFDLVVARDDSDTVAVLSDSSAPGFDLELSDELQVGEVPSELVAVDFDRDGRRDLLVLNTVNPTVTWLRNEGARLGLRQIWPAADSPVGLACGDFDRDGVLDFAHASAVLSTLTLHRGVSEGASRPLGTFADADNVGVAGDHAVDVAVGDFNSDHIPDVVFASDAAAEVKILIGGGAAGHGDGSFTEGATLTTPSAPGSIAVADLDDDGILDLVVSTPATADLVVLLGSGSNGHGDGSFFAADVLDVASQPGAAVVADVDGNHTQDILVPHYNGGGLGVLLGDGNGDFGHMTFYPTGRSWDLATGDFNCDGLLDVATRDYSTSAATAGVLLNGGNGIFAPYESWPIEDEPVGIGAADFDADGIDDILINYVDDTSEIFFGNGDIDGTFGPAVAIANGGPGHSLVADVNGDGIVDLVEPSSSVSIVVRLGNGALGKGNGTFADAVVYNGRTSGAIMLADTNGDGVGDLIAADPSGADGPVSVFTADGSCVP